MTKRLFTAIVVSTALLALASCDSQSATVGSSPPGTSGSHAVPTGCRGTLPEPSGQGPDGRMVPDAPAQLLICRYARQLPSGWRLIGTRNASGSEDQRLAAALNRAKPADPHMRCPSTETREAWIFVAESQVTVLADWCNVVVGENQTVMVPGLTSRP